MNRSSIGTGMVALCAAGCLFLNAAMAQDQNPRTTGQNQDRPGMGAQDENLRVLSSLEGQWRVSVEFGPAGSSGTSTMPRGTGSGQGAQPSGGAPTAQGQGSADFEGIATRRWVLDGVAMQEDLRITSGSSASPARFREEPASPDRPGQNPPGQTTSKAVHEQHIKSMIAEALQRDATLSASEAETKAAQIANQLTSREMSDEEVKTSLKNALVAANVEEAKAEELCTTLARQIQPHLQAIHQGSDQMTQGNEQRTQPGQTGQPQYRSASGPDLSNFQGMGLFSYDQETGKYNHVWVDNKKGCATLSIGEYDAASKTFTFKPLKASDSAGDTSPDRYRTIRGQEEGGGMGGGQEDREPAQQQPRSTNPSEGSDDEFTLRIIDQNRHVLEMTGMDNGQPIQYRVTYTKAGAGIGDQPNAPDRGIGNQPNRPGDQPRTPTTPRTLTAEKIQQLDTLITQHMQRLGIEQDTVVKHAQELREDVVEDYREGDTQNLETKIADALNDAGVESERAKTEATRLAAAIRAVLGN